MQIYKFIGKITAYCEAENEFEARERFEESDFNLSETEIVFLEEISEEEFEQVLDSL